MTTTIAQPKAPSAAPSQVFETMARIQKSVDEADLEHDYTLQAVFGRDRNFQSFTVLLERPKASAQVASHFPGDGMVMLMGPSFYEQNPEVKNDLALILRLISKQEPINNPNMFPRPIEEMRELAGGWWAGGSSSGGLRVLAMSTTFDRVDLNCDYDDRTPEVAEFLGKVDDATRILNTAMERLTHQTDQRVIAEIKDQREKLLALFGERKIYVHELPNGYGPKDDPYWSLFPWFKVTTSQGPITIGWRKRVINIDWSESEVTATGMELFPDEDTTRGDGNRSSDGGCYVHAWGYNKAKEYLDTILDWGWLA